MRIPRLFVRTEPAALDERTRESLAWAAGFFDGEGSTMATRRRGRSRTPPRLSITQVDRRSLFRFQGAVGGLGHISKPFRRRNKVTGRLSVQSVWRLTTRAHTEVVLGLLWPWLGEAKKEQANREIDRYNADVAKRLAARLICRNGHPKTASGKRCSECSKAQVYKWRAKNRERYLAYTKEYGLRTKGARLKILEESS